MPQLSSERVAQNRLINLTRSDDSFVCSINKCIKLQISQMVKKFSLSFYMTPTPFFRLRLYYIIAVVWTLAKCLTILKPTEMSLRLDFRDFKLLSLKAYVTWVSMSNFFIPLIVLIFTNASVCITIWKTLGKNSAPKITINLPLIEVCETNYYNVQGTQTYSHTLEYSTY